MKQSPPIIYTWTDEAPYLATFAFLPIIRAFAAAAAVPVETCDISLAGRIIASFPENLSSEQRETDGLAELGELVQTPEANVIKLPNISASIPQMKAAISELQNKGYDLPDYPEEPGSDKERDAKERYDRIKGSAVNPVLREGNSDRRAPRAVKEYAKANPHRMGKWAAGSKTHVSTMSDGDFRHNEKSVTFSSPTTVRFEHVDRDGKISTLKEDITLEAGEILDGTFMSQKDLVAFLKEQISDAKEKNVLFSLHMKATMMKVSDPIIFGHAVKAFFSQLFENHSSTLDRIGVDVNNGLGDLTDKIFSLSQEEVKAIQSDLESAYTEGPGLAMVNSDRGITNLHVPSDIIIDASMPPMIRDSGGMWNTEGELQDCKAVIPDSSYAGVYQAVIEDCQTHGAYDPSTMGSVPNVGLMAQKAQEYGSHDKTFEIENDGSVRAIDAKGELIFEHHVEKGDIWRACQVKDAAVRDWVKLAVTRAKATGAPAVFWLDKERAHDKQLIAKVESYLKEYDTSGISIHILAPAEATQFSLERIRKGEDSISVTGNVLRDYLTDLFPILEIGTSAKMLSIVPLMNGGGLFETGAGGSAPKHVQQFEEEGHLRWDSLGEFLALAASFDHLGEQFGNAGAKLLGETLDEATAELLLNRKAPSRKVNELDNRGSQFYLAMYWARALANQKTNPDLAERFKPIADSLAENETAIVKELNDAQGFAQDLGGYYKPDSELAEKAMRPSSTFNNIIGAI